jgi:hypothetical protein
VEFVCPQSCKSLHVPLSLYFPRRLRSRSKLEIASYVRKSVLDANVQEFSVYFIAENIPADDEYRPIFITRFMESS